MTPSAGALCVQSLTVTGLNDVVNDIVWTSRITANPTGHLIENQGVAYPPRNNVIGARSIAAHADCTNQGVCRVVKREAATENVDLRPR